MSELRAQLRTARDLMPTPQPQARTNALKNRAPHLFHRPQSRPSRTKHQHRSPLGIMTTNISEAFGAVLLFCLFIYSNHYLQLTTCQWLDRPRRLAQWIQRDVSLYMPVHVPCSNDTRPYAFFCPLTFSQPRSSMSCGQRGIT